MDGFSMEDLFYPTGTLLLACSQIMGKTRQMSHNVCDAVTTGSDAGGQSAMLG